MEDVEEVEPLSFSLMDTMTWTSDSIIEADITPEHELPTGTYSIHVQNPDGQEGVAQEAITVVQPPAFDSIDPMKVCVDGREQTFWVYGKDFLFGEESPVLEMEIVKDRSPSRAPCEQEIRPVPQLVARRTENRVVCFPLPRFPCPTLVVPINYVAE